MSVAGGMIWHVYRESRPPPHVQEVLRCVWQSRAGGPDVIVPDGCLDLIVASGQVFVAGPDTHPWRSALPAGAEINGVRFRPGQAPRVLGVAADELRDQRVALGELWGSTGRTIADRLLEQPEILTGVVASRLWRQPDPQVDLLVRRLETGTERVVEVAAGLGLGERQLRRRFTAAVGYGPATYLRVARLQRARALARHTPNLATLAAEAGYADQAHLGRDCRQLTGATARTFFRTA
jgi:AraC-like DNA-binding protein